MRENTYEVKLYLGSVEGYHGKQFSEEELVKAIGLFQKGHAESMPVRVAPTCYVHEDYSERGWEVVAICYPRLPKHREQINLFMNELAVHLLDKFKQNRISVVQPDVTVMHSSEKPEDRYYGSSNTIN